MDVVVQELMRRARLIVTSTWWDDPNRPGVGYALDLSDHLNMPDALSSFRNTDDGRFLLTVIEAYVDAFSDDWFPYTILGLPLDDARRFLRRVIHDVEQKPLPTAVEHLRSLYVRLTS